MSFSNVIAILEAAIFITSGMILNHTGLHFKKKFYEFKRLISNTKIFRISPKSWKILFRDIGSYLCGLVNVTLFMCSSAPLIE